MSAKLITLKKSADGNEVFVYRHPIMAGMRFLYNGKTDKNKIHQVGHKDWESIVSPMSETLSHKRLCRVLYENT